MKWLEILRRRTDDRGLMADLRCYLTDSKRHRAWPALSRIGIPVDDEAGGFVAGLFAFHPRETADGNLGTTCRKLAIAREGSAFSDEGAGPTERRFLHLLASDGPDEARERILRIALMAKAADVAMNFERLYDDLQRWRFRKEQIKTSWAQEYWSSDAELPADEGGDA